MKCGVCPELGLSSDILEFPGKLMVHITPPLLGFSREERRGDTEGPLGGPPQEGGIKTMASLTTPRPMILYVNILSSYISFLCYNNIGGCIKRRSK